MKVFLFYILIFALSNSLIAQDLGTKVSIYDIVDINGLKYLQSDKSSPFSGTAILESKQGKIEKAFSYKHGKLNGIVKYWHSNGILIESTEYRDGKENGEYCSYDTSGTIKIRGHFRDGNKNGIWIFYNNGTKQNEVRYKDNILLDKQRYLTTKEYVFS